MGVRNQGGLKASASHEYKSSTKGSNAGSKKSSREVLKQGLIPNPTVSYLAPQGNYETNKEIVKASSDTNYGSQPRFNID